MRKEEKEKLNRRMAEWLNRWKGSLRTANGGQARTGIALPVLGGRQRSGSDHATKCLLRRQSLSHPPSSDFGVTGRDKLHRQWGAARPGTLKSDLIQPNPTQKTLTLKYCNDANPDSPALCRGAATPVTRNGKSAKRAVKTQKLNQIKVAHLRYAMDDLRPSGAGHGQDRCDCFVRATSLRVKDPRSGRKRNRRKRP